MNDSAPQEVTRLLQQARAGRADAARSLLPLVYAELRSISQALFRGERQGHTLQPTALVHEAWLKLAGHLGKMEDRTHFLAIASRAMRQVLTDHARSARRLKRGGDARTVTLDEQVLAAETPAGNALDLVDLEDSLVRLTSRNERHARLVELRVFGGLTMREAAQTLGVTRAVAERDWFAARAWLRRELDRAG